VDGISSAAVLSKALTDYFGVEPYLLKYFISNRMIEGYGFSDKVLDRVFDSYPVPTLLITADQGSSDNDRVIRYNNYMKDQGYNHASVVISDHHEIPKNGGPKEAYAFVNPQQKDDQFPDKTICGCTVALFVMASTRTQLIKKGYLEKDTPSLKELLAYSTAATISDCVSMASETNRAIVKLGLNEINQELIPAWQSMKKHIIRDLAQPVRADTIAFGLGPRINACSRTGGDGLNGVRFYLSESIFDADRYLSMLDYDNEERKDIEKRLVKEAMEKAEKLVNQGFLSLVIFLPNGHHGIHGIVASRITESFGRPVICLSPKEYEQHPFLIKTEISIEDCEKILDKKFSEMRSIRTTYKHPKNDNFYFEIDKKDKKVINGILKVQKTFSKSDVIKLLKERYKIDVNKQFKKQYMLNEFEMLDIIKVKKDVYELINRKIKTLSGSARSIEGLNTDEGKTYYDLHKSLVHISEQYPNLFLGFGGHEMAAGMGLNIENMSLLKESFEEQARLHLKEKDVGPKIFFDGEIPVQDITLDFVDELLKLEPYGNKFPYPNYALTATINSVKIVGKNNDTGMFNINYNNKSYKAIWFKYSNSPMFNKIQPGDRCRIILEVRDQFYNQQRSVSLQIQYAQTF
jgi:single-stranded DNA-specific DHH superfamily exonuclease